jgi:hypothetical protein
MNNPLCHSVQFHFSLFVLFHWVRKHIFSVKQSSLILYFTLRSNSFHVSRSCFWFKICIWLCDNTAWRSGRFFLRMIFLNSWFNLIRIAEVMNGHWRRVSKNILFFSLRVKMCEEINYRLAIFPFRFDSILLINISLLILHFSLNRFRANLVFKIILNLFK